MATRGPQLADVSPTVAADHLRQALAREGIAADVHDGYGLALVSVWVGLVVWSDGLRYWWRVGWNGEHARPVYAWHPSTDPARAGRRVALRYADLRASHPLSEAITGAYPWV
ncbi:hypothetical protein [Nonomuraea dietziae]|uniref:hypothetical protein n=1 Tax=Nonomuraea dietziae TaxID=65515 RepID=UPI0033F16A61